MSGHLVFSLYLMDLKVFWWDPCFWKRAVYNIIVGAVPCDSAEAVRAGQAVAAFGVDSGSTRAVVCTVHRMRFQRPKDARRPLPKRLRSLQRRQSGGSWVRVWKLGSRGSSECNNRRWVAHDLRYRLRKVLFGIHESVYMSVKSPLWKVFSSHISLHYKILGYNHISWRHHDPATPKSGGHDPSPQDWCLWLAVLSQPTSC